MQTDASHRVPLTQLAEDLSESWRAVSKCTAEFLRLLLEFDRRGGYLEWGIRDTA